MSLLLLAFSALAGPAPVTTFTNRDVSPIVEVALHQQLMEMDTASRQDFISIPGNGGWSCADISYEQVGGLICTNDSESTVCTSVGISRFSNVDVRSARAVYAPVNDYWNMMALQKDRLERIIVNRTCRKTGARIIPEELRTK